MRWIFVSTRVILPNYSVWVKAKIVTLELVCLIWCHFCQLSLHLKQRSLLKYIVNCPDQNDQERLLYNLMYDIAYAILKKNKACLIVIIITMNNCLILCLRFLSVILSIKISLILRSFLLFCYITDVNEYWNQIFENFKFCLTHIGPNISENKTVL